MPTPRDPTPPAMTTEQVAPCRSCGWTHSPKALLTAPELAQVLRLRTGTIYSYKSRGLLPPSIGRPGGSPRWSSCTVAAWMHASANGAGSRP